jgi:hypothetical protein
MLPDMRQSPMRARCARYVVLLVPVAIAVAAPTAAAVSTHQVCQRAGHRASHTGHHRRGHRHQGKPTCVGALVPPSPVGPVATPQSPAEQLTLQKALQKATFDGDAHPKFVVYATTTLTIASEALDPTRRSFFPAGEGPGDASSVVDLVLMGGHFVADVPAPRGATAPTGTVLGLVFEKQSGFLEELSLTDSLPSLSRLGTLTRLR